jgi:demethylmenaquinone methyltransferase/2-methoxy-6-polyprenyl-1,4-benzoquinol methylase
MKPGFARNTGRIFQVGKRLQDRESKALTGMFNRLAPSYDLLNHLLSLGIDFRWRYRAVESLHIREGDLILDIATGTGDLAFTALKSKKCNVVGIDLSPVMLSLADRKRKSKSPAGRYTLICADAYAMPFGDHVFEHAMISYGVRNIPDWERLFSETRRILKRGGKIAILEFSIPESAVFRFPYLFYLERMLPFIGGIVSGNREPYAYLRDTVKAFPPPREVIRRVEGQGFHVLEVRPLTFGICHLYVAETRTLP